MRIVQSYWSLPSQSGPIKEGRENGGWKHKRYHYFSMALSCLLLRRFYDEVELVTDTAGKNLLIDVLGLPYTNVSTALDQFSDYPPVLWALPKLYTYSIQKNKFLHVDGDVFIWEAFKPIITQAAIVAQSPELEHDELYKNSLLYLCDSIGYVPEPFVSSTSTNDFKALNAGVLGGTDVDFISSYAMTAIGIIKDNIDELKLNCHIGSINIVLEQLLLHILSEKSNKKITYVIPDLSYDSKEVLNFHAVPIFQKYIHLLGATKRSPIACEQVELRLKYEFPDYYKRIAKVVDHEFAVPNPILKHDIDNQPDFARTQAILRKKGIYAKIEGNTKISIIKSIINILSNQSISHYVRNVYNLDKNKKLCKNFINKDYWLHKQRIYSMLEKSSRQEFLSRPLTLAPSVYITQTKWGLKILNKGNLYKHNFELNNSEPYYIITQIKEDKVVEKEMSGWEKLLLYFHNSTLSGYELLTELKDSGFTQQINIEQSILDFILIEMVYTDRLIPI